MLIAVLAAVVSSIPAEATGPKPPPGATVVSVSPPVWTSSAVHRPDKPACRGSKRAISFYRRAYRASRGEMGRPGPVPRVWYGCGASRRRAGEWRERAYVARVELRTWLRYNFAWQEWLPANWYRVGSCETGYGGPPNWRHANSSFVSAFGITRHNYSVDAARAGTPQWDDRNPPTPREQYLTALAHYRAYGDGWGCPGP